MTLSGLKQTLLDLDLYYLSQLIRYHMYLGSRLLLVYVPAYIQPRCLVKMFSQALEYISGNETAKRSATSYMIGNLK